MMAFIVPCLTSMRALLGIVACTPVLSRWFGQPEDAPAGVGSTTEEARDLAAAMEKRASIDRELNANAAARTRREKALAERRAELVALAPDAERGIDVARYEAAMRGENDLTLLLERGHRAFEALQVERAAA